MKQALLTKSKTITVTEVNFDKPELGPHDVLIHLKVTTLCASDLKYFNREKLPPDRDYPLILGHESAGVVLETGDAVTKVKVGDHVAVEPGIECGACKYCLRHSYNFCEHTKYMASKGYPGSLQERIVWPEKRVWKMDKSLDLAIGALLEPMSVAYTAIHKINFEFTNRIAILGSGGIGTLANIIVHALKPDVHCVMLDISEEKLGASERVGVYNTTFLNTAYKGYEKKSGDLQAILDTTGSGSLIKSLFPNLDPESYIGHIGFTDRPDFLSYAPAEVVAKNLTIYGAARFTDTYEMFLNLIGKSISPEHLQAVVTHKFSLDNAQEAFEAAARVKSAMKVAVLS